jgi:hypothetical protein
MGKADGLLGKTLPSDASQKYLEGWHAGQAELASGIKKMAVPDDEPIDFDGHYTPDDGEPEDEAQVPDSEGELADDEAGGREPDQSFQ